MATSNVSVRCDVPVGLRSEPMSKKLMVSLSVRSGGGVGLVTVCASGGGAAWVGNNCSMGAVAVGGAGSVRVGDKVSVGRIGCGAESELFPKSVAVAWEGWNGVGVAVEFGADVMSTNGRGTCACGVGVPQDETNTARRAVNIKKRDVFINA